MTYRPYPNADRALAQVHRHAPAEPAIPLPDCLRPMAESFTRLRVASRRAAEARAAAFPVDEYRLSTLQPSHGSIDVGEGSTGITVDAASIRPWTQAEREAWYRTGQHPQPVASEGAPPRD